MSAQYRMTGTNKSKVLEFDIMGEGTLPSVCVIHPALKNSAGEPLLQFRRVFIGQTQTRSVVLLNDGNIPSQVRLFYLFILCLLLIQASIRIFSEHKIKRNCSYRFCNKEALLAFLVFSFFRSSSTCLLKMECLPSGLLLATVAVPLRS